MSIKSQKDFFSGLMFLAIGIAFGWGATSFTVGESGSMGPGYFPLVLGVLLAALGAFTTFDALTIKTEDGEKVGKFAWKPLMFIITANVVFGVLLGGIPQVGFPSFGLIIGTYALVFIAARAGDEYKWKEVLVLATVLAIGSYVAFIMLLKLQFPVWPSFIAV